MDCINCFEATARLHLYIDRELSVEEIMIVQKHLTDCVDCGHRFHFDMKLKRLLHERCTIDRAPGHLREAVMQIARTPRGERIQIDPELLAEIQADLEEREEVI